MSETKQKIEKHTAPDRAGSVLAFLQARMGSTRLPGKVLMSIHGQSILERAVRRLRAAPTVDDVVVLTTCLREDDAIVEESKRLGAGIYRGPVRDVLARFYEAAEHLQPDIIIRATADNPLIEIGSIERIVDAVYWGGFDLCMEEGLPYGAATEAVTRKALIRAHTKAHEARHREHVTLFIKERPEEFRVAFLTPPNSLKYPQVRVTVDTPDDFDFVNQLIGKISEREQPTPLGKLLPLALSILNERECKALTSF
jgi:spore coat polysaccharide biosynthesis protein SpsF